MFLPNPTIPRCDGSTQIVVTQSSLLCVTGRAAGPRLHRSRLGPVSKIFFRHLQSCWAPYLVWKERRKETNNKPPWKGHFETNSNPFNLLMHKRIFKRHWESKDCVYTNIGSPIVLVNNSGLCKSACMVVQMVRGATSFPIFSLLSPSCTAAALSLFLCEAVHVERQ